MTDNRWLFLMENNSEPLTEEECAKGWHFCPSWDGLLVNPESYEGKFCSCITAGESGGWIFWDETGMHCSQVYCTKEEAIKASVAYAKTLEDGNTNPFHTV